MLEAKRAALELIFGEMSCLRSIQEENNLIRIRMNSRELKEMLSRLGNSPFSNRPKLIGLTKSSEPSESSLLSLVIDAGLKEEIVVLEVVPDGESLFPRASAVWKYAAWWESELERFESIRFEDLNERGGISWLQF